MTLKLLINSLMVISLITIFPSSFADDLSGPPRRPCQTGFPIQSGIPAPLKKPKEITPLGCERPFTLHGETYSTDSPQAQDASTLKYFVQDIPSSTSILDEYQSNRNLSRMGAYIGSMGVLMFLFCNTVGKQFNAASRTSVTNALRTGGVIIATGGFFFTFAYLHNNEQLIPKAVEAYNHAKPNDPIELQFNTGWRF